MAQPKQRVVVVGCGVIGAMVAYELSQFDNLAVIVLDRQPPAQDSTGAALGVLMGVISHKVKGRNWRLRQISLNRYPTLISELEAAGQRSLPYNRQGILSLCFEADQLPRWRSLQAIRQQQGYALDIWSVEQLRHRCPDLNLEGVVAAIYSPQDGQVDPVTLTQTCVAVATQRGVQFRFDQLVIGLNPIGDRVVVQTSEAIYEADRVVLAAGLGTSELSETLNQSTPIGPVLGQALRLRLEAPINRPDFQPVINGRDVHLVPLGEGDYWVGATVEFPEQGLPRQNDLLEPNPAALESVLGGAIAYCPPLAEAEIIDRWFGWRPRPQGQAAPILQPLPTCDRVMIAAGHYRNGVLLAPATALKVAEWVRSPLT
ncbi:FAD-dependent oxidoreductase [filamentous cyanobacterium CCP5]|nr:FAD-dependent oxidoreductase [filamentous cyanobacterium CCP5]